MFFFLLLNSSSAFFEVFGRFCLSWVFAKLLLPPFIKICLTIPIQTTCVELFCAVLGIQLGFWAEVKKFLLLHFKLRKLFGIYLSGCSVNERSEPSYAQVSKFETQLFYYSSMHFFTILLSKRNIHLMLRFNSLPWYIIVISQKRLTKQTNVWCVRVCMYFFTPAESLLFVIELVLKHWPTGQQNLRV